MIDYNDFSSAPSCLVGAFSDSPIWHPNKIIKQTLLNQGSFSRLAQTRPETRQIEISSAFKVHTV